MDANVVILIRREMIRRGIINPNDESVVTQRERGRKFSFEEHLKALIYALLTNQRKWSDVEPKLVDIDRLFFNYDEAKILTIRESILKKELDNFAVVISALKVKWLI